MEAFGYERIIFGSSPTGPAPSHAGDWYEIARECLAELGLEQIAIDGVFCSNAQAVYGE
jgi:predicted TIM-barrel fold metal-dependent hydrolase